MLSGLLLLGSYVSSQLADDDKFGKVQRAVRDSENRVLFSGYATANFKLFVSFTLQSSPDWPGRSTRRK